MAAMSRASSLASIRSQTRYAVTNRTSNARTTRPRRPLRSIATSLRASRSKPSQPRGFPIDRACQLVPDRVDPQDSRSAIRDERSGISDSFNLLQLVQMMNIVPRELGGDPLWRELAVLWMRELALPLGGGHPLEHREIQPAERRVGVEGGRAVGVIVEEEPGVLIERLRDVAVLARGKTHPGRQGEL